MRSAPAEISAEAKRIVQTEEHLFTSFASLWEIAIKQGLGKLNIGLNIPGIEEQCEIRGIRMLSLSSDAIERIKTLPDIHRDPSDRMLIAQAIENSLAIVTRDRIIPQYPVQTIW